MTDDPKGDSMTDDPKLGTCSRNSTPHRQSFREHDGCNNWRPVDSPSDPTPLTDEEIARWRAQQVNPFMQRMYATIDDLTARLEAAERERDRAVGVKDTVVNRLMDTEQERDELRRQIKAFTSTEDSHENLLAKMEALGWL